jgi:hypothetical protein
MPGGKGLDLGLRLIRSVGTQPHFGSMFAGCTFLNHAFILANSFAFTHASLSVLNSFAFRLSLLHCVPVQ